MRSCAPGASWNNKPKSALAGSSRRPNFFPAVAFERLCVTVFAQTSEQLSAQFAQFYRRTLGCAPNHGFRDRRGANRRAIRVRRARCKRISNRAMPPYTSRTRPRRTATKPRDPLPHSTWPSRAREPLRHARAIRRPPHGDRSAEYPAKSPEYRNARPASKRPGKRAKSGTRALPSSIERLPTQP